jgi:hypothetical protein
MAALKTSKQMDEQANAQQQNSTTSRPLLLIFQTSSVPHTKWKAGSD